MKLTETHIEQLFKFTRKHYVYHYDVQSELVDHLANDIEYIWLAQSQLSFEDARDTSFKKFGIFGFMDVIEAKQKQMNKRYRKILWRFFKEWFTVPKVIITAGIFIAIFLLLRIQFSEYILMGVFLGLIIYDMVSLFKKRKHQKKKEKKDEKIFLLEAMIGTSRNGFTGLALVNLFNFINLSKVSFSSLDNLWLLFVSLLATLVIILFYVITYVIPEKAEELLQESYPEYKIVKNL
jgi:magnesium-transporting ATPase (P-type)